MTVENDSVVEPKLSDSIRTQISSYERPQKPDRSSSAAR